VLITIKMEVLTTEALINAVQSEPYIWDSTLNETKRTKTSLGNESVILAVYLTVSFNTCINSLGL